jgi:tight adherence protein C
MLIGSLQILAPDVFADCCHRCQALMLGGLAVSLWETGAREIGSLLVAAAVTSLGLFFVSLTGRASDSESLSTLEAFRRERLRKSSFIYRVFEKGIVYLSGWLGPKGKQEAVIDAVLAWKESEVWSAGIIVGSLFGALFGTFLMLRFGPEFAVLAFIVCVVLTVLFFHTLVTAALRAKERSLLRRLPYVVDLMALVMEGGGSFLDALRTAGEENREHPLGQELLEVASKIDQGRLPAEALAEFSGRYPDENIRYFVSSINQGTELGVPLVQILRNQSDEMLRRRSQRIEKASAEAKVKISGPGFIIALACMLIMTAPFLLQVVSGFLFD